MPLLLRQLLQAVVNHWISSCVESQVVAEGASSTFRKTHGSLVTGHGPARRPREGSPRIDG